MSQSPKQAPDSARDEHPVGDDDDNDDDDDDKLTAHPVLGWKYLGCLAVSCFALGVMIMAAGSAASSQDLWMTTEFGGGSREVVNEDLEAGTLEDQLGTEANETESQEMESNEAKAETPVKNLEAESKDMEAEALEEHSGVATTNAPRDSTPYNICIKRGHQKKVCERLTGGYDSCLKRGTRPNICKRVYRKNKKFARKSGKVKEAEKEVEEKIESGDEKQPSETQQTSANTKPEHLRGPGSLKNCNNHFSLSIIENTGYNPCTQQNKPDTEFSLDTVNDILEENLESSKTTKKSSEPCISDKRVLHILYGRQHAGLLDRTIRMQVYEYVACRLNAELIFTMPCKSLSHKHGDADCQTGWDDYMRFVTYRYSEQHGMFEACPGKNLIQTPMTEDDQFKALDAKSLETSWLSDISHNAAKLLWAAQNPDASFAWQWVVNDRYDLYHVEALLRAVNATGANQHARDGLSPLPQCDIERVLPTEAVKIAKLESESRFNDGKFLALRLRRGDDLKKTAKCTFPQVIARQLLTVHSALQSSGRIKPSDVFQVYVMMEPEPEYKINLVAQATTVFQDANVTLQLVFEDDIPSIVTLYADDNYRAFAASSAIAQTASLGKISAHRTETASLAASQGRTSALRTAENDASCVIQFLPQSPFNELLHWFNHEHWRSPVRSVELFSPVSDAPKETDLATSIAQALEPLPLP